MAKPLDDAIARTYDLMRRNRCVAPESAIEKPFLRPI